MGMRFKKTPPKKKKGKGCLTGFLILFILGGICSLFTDDDNKLKSIQISVETENTYDINQSIPIDVKTDPVDTDLNNIKCNASGGTLKNDSGMLSFTAEESGDYNIYVAYEDVKSNEITIHVEDKATLEEEQKKAEQAAKQAEEEKLAAEQAEAERIAAEQAAAEQAEAERIAAEQAAQQATQEPQEKMVWISESGGRYHSKSSCSGMNNPRQVTLSEAESLGLTPCKKCY